MFSDLIYIAASIVLLLISVSMMAYSVWQVWDVMHHPELLIEKLLDSVGLIVIAIAVYDVVKYLMEEEVLRNRELRSTREARLTLTKFLVIICVAVSLEALVFIFGAGRKEVADLLYPTLLLAVSVLLMVGLGVYQRLSYSTENNDT
ncbi:MAG TPA: general glycosylation pathway protein [Gammaproteobacteria bacterium]